jgi:TolB protein
MVWQSYRDGNYEIYIANGDGGAQTRLTNTSAAEVRPRITRGGTRIVFDSDKSGNYDIYSMAPDGTDNKRLTTSSADDTSAAWSPDSTHIVFESYRNGNWEIYVMNADGTGQTRLTNNAATDGTPVWSPDGSKIAWVRRITGSNGELWVMNANGTNQTRIAGPINYMHYAAWSPDGTRIAFDADDSATPEPWNILYTVNSDGSGLQTVNTYWGGYNDSWMGSWSPDSQWLLFTRLNYDVTGDQLTVVGGYIERIKPDGTSNEVLINSGLDFLPDWQSIDFASPHSQMQPLSTWSKAPADIQWSGVDDGPAGIASYDVQYRIGAAGSWANWLANTTSTTTSYANITGQPVYFRVRARDNAGNVESWPANAQASTTLYSTLLNGALTDNRGAPVQGGYITVSTPILSIARTKDDGSFSTHLFSSTGAISITSAGIISIVNQPLQIGYDDPIDTYLPGTADLLQNGDFEFGTDQPYNWTTSGDMPIHLVTTTQQIGTQSVRMGMDCTEPCVSTPFSTLWGDWVNRPSFASDSLGNTHFAWVNDGVQYMFVDADGIQSTPEKIGDGGAATHLVVDGLNGVHVFWLVGPQLMYRDRSIDGKWSNIESVNVDGIHTNYYSQYISIAADSLGGIHVFYGRNFQVMDYTCQLVYLERLPSGIWKAPFPFEHSSSEIPIVTTGADDTVHFMWRGGRAVLYRTKTATGAWATPTSIAFDIQNEALDCFLQSLSVDKSLGVHAFWSECDGYTYYNYRSLAGEWSTSVHMPAAGWGVIDSIVDNQGTLHVVNGMGGIVYRQKLSGAKDFSDPVNIGGGGWPHAQIAMDSNGNAHIAGSGYQTTLTATQSSVGLLSQNITLTASMNEPTVAFMYELRRTPPNVKTVFEVNVDDGSSSTSVFSTTISTDRWKMEWVDLSPWRGQSVTITLGLKQAVNDPLASLFLDHVTVAEWRTPLATHVTPNHVEPNTPITLTITGENFIPTPTVKLNGAPLTDVVWVDLHTLEVSIPSGISPGIYNMSVTNPAGPTHVLTESVSAGKQSYMPVIVKQSPEAS